MHFCGLLAMCWSALCVWCIVYMFHLSNAWLCWEAWIKNIMPFALRGVFVSIFKYSYSSSSSLIFYHCLKIHLPKMLLFCIAWHISDGIRPFSRPKCTKLNTEHWTFTICYYITLLLMFCMLLAHFECTIIPLLLNPNNRELGARTWRDLRHRCKCLLSLLWTDERIFYSFISFQRLI